MRLFNLSHKMERSGWMEAFILVPLSVVLLLTSNILSLERSSLTPILPIIVLLGYVLTLHSCPVLIFVSSPRLTLIQPYFPCSHFLCPFLLFCSPRFSKIHLGSRLPPFRCRRFLASTISPDPLWLVGGGVSRNEDPALPSLISWPSKGEWAPVWSPGMPGY